MCTYPQPCNALGVAYRTWPWDMQTPLFGTRQLIQEAACLANMAFVDGGALLPISAYIGQQFRSWSSECLWISGHAYHPCYHWSCPRPGPCLGRGCDHIAGVRPLLREVICAFWAQSAETVGKTVLGAPRPWSMIVGNWPKIDME